MCIQREKGRVLKAAWQKKLNKKGQDSEVEGPSKPSFRSNKKNGSGWQTEKGG